MQQQTPTPSIQTAQTRFDATYIAAAEIAEFVGVSRVAVYKANEAGKLPNGVTVGAAWLWERATVAPYLAAWKKALATKRQSAS